MIHLIPRVKTLIEGTEPLSKTAIFFDSSLLDSRVAKALSFLPQSKDGLPLSIALRGEAGEGYELTVNNDGISITADSNAGAFYAVQTLRQIWAQKNVPCLQIKDKPDFPYRGFYHDVTRGKIPSVKTLKELIDRMAYYKLNSLQLYVEHVFEFKECADLIPHTGALTGAELEELDAYCKENFIDFVPSLSTFGHMYEILQQPKYQHLRVLSDYEYHPNFWHARMAHHTIDPLQDESFELVSNLIDQFAPHFSSDTFNICCDETFDLTQHKRQDLDQGQMYVDFVQKIISHLKAKNKTVMMWADILLKHPETIDLLPEDTVFLNWMYSADPDENKIIKFASLGRKQIVCPGTTTWNRLCENVQVAEKNICLMAEYGKKHGALGVLNTNWGDWGNPCSIELALYGLVLGAEKSWSADTPADDTFHAAVNTLLYGNEKAFDLLCRISAAQNAISWPDLCREHVNPREEGQHFIKTEKDVLQNTACACREIRKELEGLSMDPEIRREMILATDGLCLIAELSCHLMGYETERTVDGAQWLADYGAAWKEKNKNCELYKIEEMFRTLLAR